MPTYYPPLVGSDGSTKDLMMYDSYNFDLLRQSLYQHNPQAAAFHCQQTALLTDNAYQRERIIMSDNMILFIPIAPTSNHALLKVISNLKKSKKHERFKKDSRTKKQYPSQ